MVKFDKTVVIAAPLGEVFDYVSQPENFPDFVSITDFQFLTDKHRGIDTRIRYNFICGGKRILSECTLAELSIDKSVAFHTTKGLATKWEFSLKEGEDGTELRWTGENEVPANFLDKLLGRSASVQQAMEATIDDGLQKLKDILEST
jgi:ribosome-associated toxin RatA of RatAB toxin-antitoxin module